MGVLSLAHEAQLARALEVARDVVAGGSLGAVSTDELAGALYGQWYAAPNAEVAAMAAGAERSGRVVLPLAAILRASHPDAEVWTPAVVVRPGLHGTIVVQVAEGGIRAVARGDLAPELTVGVGRGPHPGDRVRVRARAGGLVEGGWWRTWGGGCRAGRAPTGDLTRMYLAPRPEMIRRLVSAVLGVLRDLDVPWLFKVGADWPMLARPDGAVLYLPDPAVGLVSGAATPLVARLVGAVDGLVAGPGPALSVPVAPGVSWVQDPGDGLSFGETLCRALARAVLSRPGLLAPDGGTSRSEDLTVLAVGLGEAGIDPRAPHLRPLPKEAA